ncbi:hypothetical protein GCM10011609_09450 [Lentzea pudingi]|uniref:DUF1996 domain-containing protein n=1 Tax=Lentzea pudingi TaxID=1789439 RepID=A0ABQ2HCD5_9PSEU|nr:DUF1996 domain-containing protein [Lentzea pudingi]GGM75655.1 hypothetical protein GCM10011609_09450 [Lentzea pudingi]
MSRKLSALAVTAGLVAAVFAVVSQSAQADDYVSHHEFQANCAFATDRPDDPIVFPGLPGASHLHTFLGNNSINASSTNDSLRQGSTNCVTPDDKSAYWFPSVLNGDQVVRPIGNQVVYYKSGILKYQDVRPFPPGMRFVVGSPTSTLEQFRDHPGAVEGFECGDSAKNWDIPAWCAPGSQLNVRFQAPSCWNGRDLDSADHKSHMAYPDRATLVCPPSHPVAVPMIEFKMAFPVSGDMSRVRLSSGRGYTWHYDFMNAWDAPTQAALVRHCVNGGLQCDPRGYDQYKPHRGAALGPDYRLPR